MEKVLCQLYVGNRRLAPEQAERLTEAHLTFWEQHRAVTRAINCAEECMNAQGLRRRDLERQLKAVGRDDAYVTRWLAGDRKLQELADKLSAAQQVIHGSKR